jgi:hypothetical protein
MDILPLDIWPRHFAQTHFGKKDQATDSEQKYILPTDFGPTDNWLTDIWPTLI